MEKRIAVLGTGAIGGMLGAHLAHAGLNITMVSAFRRTTAEKLQQDGIYIDGARGAFHTPVQAAFLDDLTPEDQFDYVFLGLKANDYVNAVTRMAPHLKPDGCIVTLQNGINEEFLTPIVGDDRVVAGISFAGGQQQDANHFTDHDGHFVVGEMDGSITPRIQEIVEILSNARPSSFTEHIRARQWEKLGTVALHVPCCTITGCYMQEAFDDPQVQQFFPLLASEVFAVAEADGCPDITVQGITREDFRKGRMPGGMGPMDQEPEGKKRLPPKIIDAYTRDIQRGADLEIDYTNGTIVRLGRRYGIPTPANEAVIAAIRDIEAGRAKAGPELAQKVLNSLH